MALAIQLQNFEKLGPHHVNVAISYDNLGNVLAELSAPPEAGKGVF